MQDAQRMILDFTSTSSFFGIFDGHGVCGDYAARFFAENLPGSLQSLEINNKNVVETCLEIDKAFVTASRKDEKDYLDSGTTAVFCVLQKEQKQEKDDSDPHTNKPFKLIVGNIGDSRCVLIRNGVAADLVPLTVDHKPMDQKEKERIETAGGLVAVDRVDGLAVSRAFGDFRLKSNENLSPDKQKVICVPDIVEMDGIGGNDILLLMCDGVYEKTDNQHVVDTIMKYYIETPDDPGRILQQLFDERANSSDDNMTAMIVFFKDGSAYRNRQMEFVECEVKEHDDKMFRKAYKQFARSHGCRITKRKKSREESECKESKKKKKTTHKTAENTPSLEDVVQPTNTKQSDEP